MAGINSNSKLFTTVSVVTLGNKKWHGMDRMETLCLYCKLTKAIKQQNSDNITTEEHSPTMNQKVKDSSNSNVYNVYCTNIHTILNHTL